ncbi:MAG: protein-export chaperone SecB [Clostridia bacterium]|nr:protein-export chaperone SecB [Clostridia bacterium]MBR4726321.1 protein-export chaperone SecB [Clostridia bacterium]
MSKPIVTFKACRATEINFVNKLENGTRVEFERKYGYNVKYAPNGTCIGEFTVETYDKEHPDKFAIKAVMQGIFAYDSSAQKELIHVASFKELFPYMRAMVATVSTAAGVPPIHIPNFDIESQNIYRFGNS